MFQLLPRFVVHQHSKCYGDRRPQTADRLALRKWPQALGFLVLSSSLTMCSKDTQEPLGVVSQGPSTEAIVTKIQEFRRSYAEPIRTKSLVEYTPEEAEWIVEGSFNWGTYDPEAKYGDMKVDEYLAEVTMANGKVKESDLLEVYATLEAAVAADPLEAGKELHVIDVEAKVEGGTLKLTTQRVSAQQTPPFNSNALNTNFTGNHRGRSEFGGCSVNSSDAAIQGRINAAIGALSSIYTVINVQRWEVRGATPFLPGQWIPFVVSDLPNRRIAALTFPNPNDLTPVETWWFNQAVFDDYRTYYTPESLPLSDLDQIFNTCLSPTAMTYLTQSTFNLMGLVRTNYVQNNAIVPLSCRVQGWRIRLSSNNQGQFLYRMGHNVTYTYGQLIIAGPTG